MLVRQVSGGRGAGCGLLVVIIVEILFTFVILELTEERAKWKDLPLTLYAPGCDYKHPGEV
jgi:hypothetical protein